MSATVPFTKREHRVNGLLGIIAFYTGNPYRIYSHIGIIIGIVFNFNIYEVFIKNPDSLIPFYFLNLSLIVIPSYILLSRLAKRVNIKKMPFKRKLIWAIAFGALLAITMETEAVFLQIDVLHSAIQFFGIKIPQSVSDEVFFGTIFAALWIPITDAMTFHLREIKNWLKPFNNSKSAIAGISK